MIDIILFYILQIAYSMCDPGNYFVIPGSPEEAWEVDKQIALVRDNTTLNMEYGPSNFVVAIVGTQLSYRGLWLDHAFVLKALYPLLVKFGDSSSQLKVIISAGDSNSNYSSIVEVRF